MRSNASPPKYGAEGPPGGPEAWAQQRAAGAQPQGGKDPNMMRRLAGMVAGMNPQAMQAMQAQRQTQPNWSQGGAVQWPQPGQGQVPGPPAQPPSGASMMPNTNVAPPPMPPAQPPQQTGMAGLGQAMGKGAQMMRQANALRGGGGMRGMRTREY